MAPSLCSDSTIYSSPASQLANRYLYSTCGDNYGLLVRAWDNLDHGKDERLRTPASILHALIQPRNSMYPLTVGGTAFAFAVPMWER